MKHLGWWASALFAAGLAGVTLEYTANEGPGSTIGLVMWVTAAATLVVLVLIDVAIRIDRVLPNRALDAAPTTRAAIRRGDRIPAAWSVRKDSARNAWSLRNESGRKLFNLAIHGADTATADRLHLAWTPSAGMITADPGAVIPFTLVDFYGSPMAVLFIEWSTTPDGPRIAQRVQVGAATIVQVPSGGTFRGHTFSSQGTGMISETNDPPSPY